MKQLIILFTLLILFFGCTQVEPIKELDSSGSTQEGLNTLVNNQNEFAYNIYNQIISENEENVFLSPYSISTAFGMVYEGANGVTATEMQSVLKTPTDNNLRHYETAKLYQILNKKEKQYELNTANALWLQKDYPFANNYLNTINNYYGAEMTNVDFKSNGFDAINKINSWAAQKTNNRIPKVLEPLMDTKEMKMVLTNSIYFKGKWLNEFNKKNTRKENFYKLDGSIIEKDFMHQNENLNYYDNNNYEVLELPYKDKELSMVIFLPKKGSEYEKIRTISKEEMELLMKSMYPHQVNVSLPKFTFKTHYSLKEPLNKMGMNVVFTDDADLSRINGIGELKIDFALHDAFVEVNEEGTEAAAITTIGIVTTSARPDEPTNFVADHPFTFIIKENKTSAILFIGNVIEPTIQN